MNTTETTVARAPRTVPYPTAHNARTRKSQGNRGTWVVITWSKITCRFDWWTSFITREAAVRWCDGKFMRGPGVRVVRVQLDGKMGAVVDPFAGKRFFGAVVTP